MAFLPSNSFMRFELGADFRVRRRLPPLLPTIAAARDGAAFGFTCHKMHVSLKELRSGTANWRAMTEKIDIKLNINGHDHAVHVEPRKTLVDVIRDECGLTGTHIGCEHGICGACTVILDDEAVRSCLMFAVQAQGKRIRTVEGLADGDKLHPVQSAFIEHHALQCGFCTPGFLMLTVNALETNPDLTDDDILDLLSSNLCRCTGYQNIVKAVRSTVTEMRRQAAR
jgi:carbon-monoxide dehydrogenase small subunit